MACFLVPATEAIVTTIATGIIEKKEMQQTVYQAETLHAEKEGKTEDEATESNQFECSRLHRRSLSGKMKWLNTMLWGGSALLAFEHLWHGEIVPWYPFLTAAGNPEATAQMFHEMSTVGVAMAGVVTLAWGVMAAVSSRMEHRVEQDTKLQESEG